MRVVIAPDKFKGSLTAGEAASAIASGLREVWSQAIPHAEYVCLPMADGGEGTVDAFLALADWRPLIARVRGPLGEERTARIAYRDGTAICEMALASGLAFMAPGDDRGAVFGSSYGTGELIRAALDAGAKRIVMGVGGTATNDGGAGALAALGARLLDGDGRDVAPGGAGLAELARIDVSALDPRLRDCTLEIATDVDHPLLGPSGASAVFGPQKGASPQDVVRLDAALAHFADVVAASGGNDTRVCAGSGAGGGIAFGIAAFADAHVSSGFALVADVMELRGALEGATMCCTGEGSIDMQTLGGKVVVRVAELARARTIDTYAFGGRVDPDAKAALAERGCVAIEVADRTLTLDQNMRGAATLLRRRAASLARRALL